MKLAAGRWLCGEKHSDSCVILLYLADDPRVDATATTDRESVIFISRVAAFATSPHFFCSAMDPLSAIALSVFRHHGWETPSASSIRQKGK